MPVVNTWYNGFSPKERDDKYKVMCNLMAKGELPTASGPCALCGDPEVPVEYHDEDYGEPFLWNEPAVFVLCHHCHVHKIHTRFQHPAVWNAFIAHVRRGGYAREWNEPSIKEEIAAYRAAIEHKHGEVLPLGELRPYKRIVGTEWFANLRMDPESLMDPAARPRGPADR
jgi:hypothetical protein